MKVISQLSNVDVMDVLKDTKAIMKGHFKLTSGFHSEYYVQCARLLQHPDKSSYLIDKFLDIYSKDLQVDEIDTIISPAVGGILFGYLLAYKLGKRMVFTERKDNIMTLGRGFELGPEEKVIVAEDVVTTGGSVLEVIDICKERCADVRSIISIIDRSSDLAFDHPYYSFIKIEIDNYRPKECPKCKDNIKIDYLGSRERQ